MYLKDFECDLLIIREIFPLFLIPLLIHWNCSIFLKGYYYYVDGVILHHLDNLVSTHEVLFTLIPGSYCYKINSIKCNRRLPWWLSSEESACDAGDVSLIPRLRRSPGKGNGNPLRILAWEIPWTEEPGRLQSMTSQRVGHDLVTKQQQAFGGWLGTLLISVGLAYLSDGLKVSTPGDFSALFHVYLILFLEQES